jgi:hypothetical protein
MSEQQPLQTKIRGFEVTGYMGLGFSFFGIFVFGNLVIFPSLFSITLPFLIPGILLCAGEVKRYKRRTTNLGATSNKET